MKKVEFFALIILVSILSACGLAGNDLDKALNNMSELESVRIDMKMENVPLFGTVAGYSLVDGDYNYTSFFGQENYNITKDEKEYDIVDFLDEKYAVEVVDEDSDDDDDLNSSLYDEFDSDNFTENEEGYYVSDINYEDMSNVKVKLDNGYISELTAKFDSDGYVIDVTFEFSGFNATTIEFPEFTYMDSYETALYRIIDEGLTYTSSSTGFQLSEWTDTIVYEYNNNFFTIENWGESQYFYPETQEIIDGNNTYSLSDYFDNETYPAFELHIFELLTDLYNEMG